MKELEKEKTGKNCDIYGKTAYLRVECISLLGIVFAPFKKTLPASPLRNKSSE